MAYTMATNRHIMPKPGQGARLWAAAALMTAPRAMPSTTVTVSAQYVDRTERSLVHSERSASAKVAVRIPRC